MQNKVKKTLDYFKLNGLGVVKYLAFFCLFYLFNNTLVLGTVSPCFYAFFLTLLFLGEQPFYLLLAYLLATVCSGITVPAIIFSLVLGIVGGAIVQIHKHKGKIIPVWLAFVYGLIFGLIHMLVNLSTLQNFYITTINAIFNSVFLVCSLNFLRVVKIRNFNLNLNVDEVVCGCVILAFVFCGLANVNLYGFDVVKLIGILFILLSNVTIKNNAFSIILSLVCGLGVTLCNCNLTYVATLGTMGIFTYIFREQFKIYSALLVVIVDLIFSLFILPSNNFTWVTVLPSLIASVVFMCVPKRVTNKLSNIFFLSSKSNSLKNILNQNKLQVSKRLLYTSQVFYEMYKNFSSLVKGNLDIKNAKLLICNEVIKNNCANCPQRAKCLKGFNSELKKIFENLVNVGFEKGKITLVDLPAYLTNRCGKLNQVVTSMNSLLTEYKNYSKMIGNLDASKVLIAEQLGGISSILLNLSQETKQVVNVDESQEKLIKETLVYNNIIPSEVVCFEKDEKTNVVSLIIRTTDFDNEKITMLLSKIFKNKMIVEDILESSDSNLTYVSYKTAPVYDIALGIAQTSKGGEVICGDTHSTSKLIGDKFMVALCDGMGHGEKANSSSELSLSLIENFYKAGFDDQTILTSVNKLLNLSSQEVFSALDISVVDLKNGEVDFIKQGATIGFVKKGEVISKIESNSLPMGILEEVKPKVTKTVLSPDDYVIMLSDGVVDAFGEEELLQNFLKNINLSNPQEVADRILNRAKREQQNYPDDDMTVLVAKLFYNFA